MERFIDCISELNYGIFYSYFLISILLLILGLMYKVDWVKELKLNLGFLALLAFLFQIIHCIYYDIENLFSPSNPESLYELYAYYNRKNYLYFVYLTPLLLYGFAAFLNLKKKRRTNYLVIVYSILIGLLSPFDTLFFDIIYKKFFSSYSVWNTGEFIAINYNFNIIVPPSILGIIGTLLLVLLLISSPILIKQYRTTKNKS